MINSFLSDTLGIPWNGGSVLPGSMSTMAQGGSYFVYNSDSQSLPLNTNSEFKGGGKRTRHNRKTNKRTRHNRKTNNHSSNKRKANKRTRHIHKHHKVYKIQK